MALASPSRIGPGRRRLRLGERTPGTRLTRGPGNGVGILVTTLEWQKWRELMASRAHKPNDEPMLKKTRSAPNTAVIPVVYYPDVRAAVEWLTTVLPFTERLRNSENRCQLSHGNGAIVVS